MTLDLKNIYYFTPMIRFEYMNVPFAIIPNEIIAQYNLKDKGGWIYIDNRLPYPVPTSTKTASMTTIKILLNSTIFTPGACFMTLDLNFFKLFSHDKVQIHEAPFSHHSR